MTELTLGELVIFPERQEVARLGQKIRLRRKEYALLEFLARNREQVISRLTILEYVWSYGTQAATNTLETHMSGLRRKIDGGFKKKLIHTFHGMGYMFSENGPGNKPVD
jgi:DNA-binding response OmpR family regulator